MVFTLTVWSTIANGVELITTMVTPKGTKMKKRSQWSSTKKMLAWERRRITLALASQT
jgi:hypothetical protein